MSEVTQQTSSFSADDAREQMRKSAFRAPVEGESPEAVTSRQMDLKKLRAYAEQTAEFFGDGEPCGVPAWVVIWLLDHLYGRSEKASVALVNAYSLIDLAKGSHFPDEFVRDMRKGLSDLVAVVEEGRD